MFAPRRALRRLRALAWQDLRIAGEAALLLPAVHVLQKALPFRRWRSLLTRDPPPAAPRPGAPDPGQIARAVERARRAMPGPYRCLPTAYTAHLLLARYGHPSHVHVGVARDAEGKVEAHAWVACGGRIIVGDLPDLARFAPLPPL